MYNTIDKYICALVTRWLLCLASWTDNANSVDNIQLLLLFCFLKIKIILQTNIFEKSVKSFYQSLKKRKETAFYQGL